MVNGRWNVRREKIRLGSWQWGREREREKCWKTENVEEKETFERSSIATIIRIIIEIIILSVRERKGEVRTIENHWDRRSSCSGWGYTSLLLSILFIFGNYLRELYEFPTLFFPFILLRLWNNRSHRSLDSWITLDKKNEEREIRDLYTQVCTFKRRLSSFLSLSLSFSAPVRSEQNNCHQVMSLN